MQIKVRFADLSEEKILTARKVQLLIRLIKQHVREVSFAVERRIKPSMPVDTGRARASWGHWTPQDIHRISINNPPSPGDALWTEKDDGYTIEQGSNVGYIASLNDGSSKQAPAGFIDRAEEAGQQAIDAKVEEAIARFARDDS
jgi:hypothetical protein